MKRVLVLIVLLGAVIGSPAMADVRPKTMAPAAAPYDWSGVYIGLGLGAAWSQANRFYPDLPLVGIPPTTFTSRSSDLIYNVHGGVQWQWGQWVFGVEAAYNVTPNDMRSDVSVSPPEPFTTLQSTTKITNLITIGPRVGYAWDRFLVYATGGYAGANVDGLYSCKGTNAAVFPGPGACGALFGSFAALDFGGKTWNNGWFLGVGFDYVAFKGTLGDVLIGAEYQHFDLNRKQAFTCTPAICGALLLHQGFLHDANGDIVRLRLSFKMNPFGR